MNYGLKFVIDAASELFFVPVGCLNDTKLAYRYVPKGICPPKLATVLHLPDLAEHVRKGEGRVTIEPDSRMHA